MIFVLSDGEVETCFAAPGDNSWRTFSLDIAGETRVYEAKSPNKQGSFF